MRSSRLLSIQMHLQLRGCVSAEALAREFEVSVRTIYRDVDALSASGVPVFAQRGRNGGIALHEGYRTRLTGMTTAEARSVPLAGLPMAARDLGLGVDAAAAQRKLMTSLPELGGADAQLIAERFHIDPVPWYHRAEVVDWLPTLAAAAWQDRRVRITYEGWDGQSQREVGPLGLVLKGGLWYLVAMAAGRPRTYRVSAIRSLEATDAKVARPRSFDLAQYWPRSVAQFEARLMRTTARVLITEEGLRILRAVSPAAAERVQATQQATSRVGWMQAELPIESPAYSARQILRLGTEVEVLAPPEVRRAVAREAAAVARRHLRAVR
ncbi:helix-turn-helix transcriptional regulator [Caenimonas koreensis]|uniref:helix-turn-helix transcriptional regulator n=1 Tax=Caenimonas koreensis TaxID=367474 RepID=UPI003783B50C